MQGVAELVEQGLDLVVAQQRGCRGRRLREVRHDRRDRLLVAPVREPAPGDGCGWVGTGDELWCVGTDGIERSAEITGLRLGGSDRLAILASNGTPVSASVDIAVIIACSFSRCSQSILRMGMPHSSLRTSSSQTRFRRSGNISPNPSIENVHGPGVRSDALNALPRPGTPLPRCQPWRRAPPW